MRFPTGARKLIFSKVARPYVGPKQPSVQRELEAIYPAVERPERETDYSTLSTAEVNNE